MHRTKTPILLLLAALVLALASCATAGEPERQLPVLRTVAAGPGANGSTLLELSAERLLAAGYAVGDAIAVGSGPDRFVAGITDDPDDVGKDLPTLLTDGSTLSLTAGNRTFAPGSTLTIGLYRGGGYVPQMTLHDLPQASGREGYRSDAAYADFRAMESDAIAPRRLYRSGIGAGSAPYADALAKRARIATIIDLSDGSGWTGDLPHYRKLQSEGAVITLDLGTDTQDPAFPAKIAEGLRFLAGHSGPYLICGDETGFFTTLVWNLMGATVAETTEDYMQTFVNRHGLKRRSDAYRQISTVPSIHLQTMNGGTPVTRRTLGQAAVRYLSETARMTKAEVFAVRERLSPSPVRITGTFTFTL